MQRGDNRAAHQLTCFMEDKEDARWCPKGMVAPLSYHDAGVIAVDLDNTVGSFDGDMRQAIMRYYGLTFNQALRLCPPNGERGLLSWWGGDADASYRTFLDMESCGLLYAHQPVRERAGEVLNWLYERVGKGRLFFLTARDQAYHDVSAQWLRDRVGVRFEPHILHSSRKERVKEFDTLIDDDPRHVNAVSSHRALYGGRHVVFMSKSWNYHEAQGYKVHHAFSWLDVQKTFSTSTGR